MMRLSLEDEAGNVRVVPLQDGVLTIGRAADNDLVLPERNVSRHHARILCEGGRCFLEDAGSRYGIRWNGGTVPGRMEVRRDQVFQVGDFRLKLLAEDDALAEEGPEEAETPLATPTVSLDSREASGEPAGGDSLRKIRELEEFARQGWASDFEAEEPAERLRAWRYIVVLLVLLLVAAGLTFVYFRLSDEPVLAPVPTTTSSPPRPEPVGTPGIRPQEENPPARTAPGSEGRNAATAHPEPPERPGTATGDAPPAPARGDSETDRKKEKPAMTTPAARPAPQRSAPRVAPQKGIETRTPEEAKPAVQPPSRSGRDPRSQQREELEDRARENAGAQ